MSGPEDVLPLLTNGDTGPEKPYYAVFDFSALNCFKCDLFNASGICKSGESFCETQGSQSCFLRKVYEGKWSLRGLLGVTFA